jgi:GNAT superfamily N-acetyltransferase
MNNFGVSRALEGDFGAIMGLIREASLWLRTKDTDQWSEPWPSEAARNERVVDDLRRGKTWIVKADDGVSAATITIEEVANPKVWTEWEASESSVYVHRLIVGRRYASMKLGASLLNWAAEQAGRAYGARLMRIDVWTTNEALHRYYEDQGFIRVRDCADETYPSRARFERATDWKGDGGQVRLNVDPIDIVSLPRSIRGRGYRCLEAFTPEARNAQPWPVHIPRLSVCLL